VSLQSVCSQFAVSLESVSSARGDQLSYSISDNLSTNCRVV